MQVIENQPVTNILNMKKNPPIKSMYKNKVQIIIPLELVKWARVIGYSPEQTAQAILEWFINPLKK